MNELLHVDDQSPETCVNSFQKIAASLMNNFKLQAGQKFYRIIDCEFYYGSEKHDDCYVHRHPQQGSTGQWYFHGSGLDLTIAGEKSCGGILIRGIAEVTKEAGDPFVTNAIKGPLNVCTEIFKSFGSAFKQEPTEFSLIDISPEPMGALMKRASVFAVPRVRLNKEKDTGDYHSRPYRFITFLNLPHNENDRIKNYLTTESGTPLSLDEFNAYKKGKML